MLNKCSFYRDSENIGAGKGLGVCDLDGCQAICDGDIQFCEKPDQLRSQLSKQKEKEVFNIQILVVDDEEPIRKLISTLLSTQGYQCITASNGSEALNKILQNTFGAVITDIVMPEMDGITLIKKLLSLYPNLPIMVITGFSQEYPTESALSVGARDFISKPFSNDEFILRFKKMMSDHEMFCQMRATYNERVLDSQGNLKK